MKTKNSAINRAADQKLKETTKSLSEIEIKALLALPNTIGAIQYEEISKKAEISIDSIRRALGWLKEKGLVETKETTETKYKLTKKGAKCVEAVSPKRELIKTIEKLGTENLELLSKEDALKKIMEESGLTAQEFCQAIKNAKEAE